MNNVLLDILHDAAHWMLILALPIPFLEAFVRRISTWFKLQITALQLVFLSCFSNFLYYFILRDIVISVFFFIVSVISLTCGIWEINKYDKYKQELREKAERKPDESQCWKTFGAPEIKALRTKLSKAKIFGHQKKDGTYIECINENTEKSGDSHLQTNPLSKYEKRSNENENN